MNIFVTSPDYSVSAYDLDDRRVIKMILETAQLLSTAVWQVTQTLDPQLYKPTHVNHPCSVWARTSKQNFAWLFNHGCELNDVYRVAYGKTHKSLDIILAAFKYRDQVPDIGMTPFANCTTFKDIPNVHEAYRKQMNVKWQNDTLAGRVPTWKNREIPSWKE